MGGAMSLLSRQRILMIPIFLVYLRLVQPWKSTTIFHIRTSESFLNSNLELKLERVEVFIVSALDSSSSCRRWHPRVFLRTNNSPFHFLRVLLRPLIMSCVLPKRRSSTSTRTFLSSSLQATCLLKILDHLVLTPLPSPQPGQHLQPCLQDRIHLLALLLAEHPQTVSWVVPPGLQLQTTEKWRASRNKWMTCKEPIRWHLIDNPNKWRWDRAKQREAPFLRILSQMTKLRC